MKTIIKTKNLISSILAAMFCVLLAFSFSSCEFFNFDQISESDLVTYDDNDESITTSGGAPAAQTGNILLTFTPHFTGQNNTISSNSRSAYPDFSDISALSLSFSIKSANVTETSGTYDSTTGKIIFRIPSRTITTSEEFTIYAIKDSAKVMVATTTFTYTPGGASSTVTSSINFIPYTSANGNTGTVANGYLNLGITTSSSYKITVAFTGSPGITVTGGETASVTLSNPDGGIAPGSYEAQISIKNVYGVLCDFYIQTIQVWPGLTTNNWYLNDGTTASTINFSVSDTEQKYYVCGSNPTGLYSSSGIGSLITSPSSSNSGDITHPLDTINGALAKCTNQNINYKIICDGDFSYGSFNIGSDGNYNYCKITICGGGNSDNFSQINTGGASSEIYSNREFILENLKIYNAGINLNFYRAIDFVTNAESGCLILNNCEISGNKHAIRMTVNSPATSSLLIIQGSTYIPVTDDEENDIQIDNKCKIYVSKPLDTSHDTGNSPRKIAGFKVMSGDTESGVVGTTQYVYATNGAHLATECQRFEYLGYPKVLTTDGKLTYAKDFYVASSTSTPAGSSTGNGSPRKPLDKISSVLPKIKEAANTTGYAGEYTIHISGIIQETSRIEIQSGDYPSSLSLGAFTGSTLKLCGTNNANDKLDGSLLSTGAEILKVSGTNGYPLNLSIENLTIEGNHLNGTGININNQFASVKLDNGALITKCNLAIGNDGTLIMCGTAQIGAVTNICPASEDAAITNGGNVSGIGIDASTSYIYLGYNSASVDDPDDDFTGGIYGCYNYGIQSIYGNVYMHKGTIGYNNEIGIYSSQANLHIAGGKIIENNGGAITYANNIANPKSFEMSGNIYIPEGSEGKNIVKLDNSDSIIKITDSLNPPAEAGGIVATIVPYSYANTTTVLEDNSSGTLVAANFEKFNIADEVIAGPPASTQGWHLISDGTIKQSPTLSFVTVASRTQDVFDGTEAITGSDVFIENRNLGRMNSLIVSDHEVTQGEYETYCYYGGCDKPTVAKGKGRYYPAYYVSWYDALVYCNLKTINDTSLGATREIRLSKCAYTINGSKDPADWPNIGTATINGATKYCGSTGSGHNGYKTAWENVECDFAAEGWRLPARAEWEWLARDCNLTNSGQNNFCGTNNYSDISNYAVWNTTMPAEVKTKLPNTLPNGQHLYDMAGNVAEMCWDWDSTQPGYKINSTTPFTGPENTNTNFFNRRALGGDYSKTDWTSLRVTSWNNIQYTYNSYTTSYHNTDATNGFRVVRTTESFRPIGNKMQPDAVGDIVFNDGSATSYTQLASLTDAQKAAAIAIIFYKGTGLNNGSDNTTSRTLGVGLKHNKSGLAWCKNSANAFSKNITTIQCTAGGSVGALTFTDPATNDRNGSDNLEQISSFSGVSDATGEGAANKYPAFYFAKNYKEQKIGSESSSRIPAGSEFENGWYLPSFAELFQIYANGKGTNNVFDIDAASEALGGNSFGTSNYWSSSQYTSLVDNAIKLSFSDGSWVFNNKDKENYGACAIREF